MIRKIVLVIFSLIVLLTIFNMWFFNQPCVNPEKPIKLSQKAKWFGGCDGGNWIELIKINEQEELIRFKIYRDYDGALEMDANFKINDCDFKTINNNNWSDYIVGYMNETITLKGEKNCYLKLVYPAFGGEDWEIIKEKILNR